MLSPHWILKTDVALIKHCDLVYFIVSAGRCGCKRGLAKAKNSMLFITRSQIFYYYFFLHHGTRHHKHLYYTVDKCGKDDNTSLVLGVMSVQASADVWSIRSRGDSCIKSARHAREGFCEYFKGSGKVS